MPEPMTARRKPEKGILDDSVSFIVVVSNHSNCTWDFDLSDALKASDEATKSYAMVKDKPGCPAITFTPGQRQELSLLYVVGSVGTNPHIESQSPLPEKRLVVANANANP